MIGNTIYIGNFPARPTITISGLSQASNSVVTMISSYPVLGEWQNDQYIVTLIDYPLNVSITSYDLQSRITDVVQVSVTQPVDYPVSMKPDYFDGVLLDVPSNIDLGFYRVAIASFPYGNWGKTSSYLYVESVGSQGTGAACPVFINSDIYNKINFKVANNINGYHLYNGFCISSVDSGIWGALTGGEMNITSTGVQTLTIPNGTRGNYYALFAKWYGDSSASTDARKRFGVSKIWLSN